MHLGARRETEAWHSGAGFPGKPVRKRVQGSAAPPLLPGGPAPRRQDTGWEGCPCGAQASLGDGSIGPWCFSAL